MKHFFAILFLSSLAWGVDKPDGCKMLPTARVQAILGMTRNVGMTKLTLPPKASFGGACTYVGAQNDGTIIAIKFPTPTDAQTFFETLRESLKNQGLKLKPEDFGSETGFSFPSGMIALRSDLVIRGNVTAHPQPGQQAGLLNFALSKQLMIVAIKWL
jgi:hypothetical protein